MARMFPSPLPTAIRNDPGRRAEVLLYDCFERGLGGDYAVFHGVAWLAPRADRRRLRDGEADFAIVHADHGILLLEAKGGEIRRDGHTGEWTSTARGGAGRTYTIKDPFEQARTSKHALIGKLEALPDWDTRRRAEAFHAVAFPDCAPTAGSLGPDAPREIVITADDLRSIGGKVESIFRHWRAAGPPARLGAEGVELITRLLAPSYEFRSPLGVVLAEADREILRLTEQQFRVLDLLSRTRRVAVHGGAGTGKTLLAMEKARRLATEGMNVLLTCYSRPLADYLRRSAGGTPRLDVMTFHQLCFGAALGAGVPLADPYAGVVGQDYFERTMPEALLAALEKNPGRYDAVVVDEGQDFLDGWWVPLALCQADPDAGILYVFHDDNQRIYRRQPSFPAGLVDVPLFENHRNTLPIHAAASRFYQGTELRALGPPGPEVEVTTVKSEATLEAVVGRLLGRMIGPDRIAPDDVVVLTARAEGPLSRKKKIGDVACTADQDAYPGRVLVSTIHRFKGLERRVVVLADVDSIDGSEADALFYVALTRARTHLAVVASSGTLRHLALSS